MNGWYRTGYLLSKAIAKVCFSFKAIHSERIPQTGGVILAMNHQSFLDPPLAGISTTRELHYLARKTLLKWPVLGPILPKLNVVPVDQDRADMSAIKTIIHLVREGHASIIFPEGGRTLDGQLQPAQPGLGLVVAKTLAPVVPMRVFGAYEAFPRGAKGVRCVPITIVVGEPIVFTKDDLQRGRADYLAISQRVMERISAIQLEGR